MSKQLLKQIFSVLFKEKELNVSTSKNGDYKFQIPIFCKKLYVGIKLL